MVRGIKPVFVVFLLFLLIPGYAFSDEWSITGTVDQDLSYDDNVCMRPDGQSVDRQCRQQGRGNPQDGSFKSRQGSFKYRIIPVITFQHQTDITNVSASASYGTQMFTDLEGFDQDIQNYRINGLYQTEIIDWGLQANYSITPSRNNIQTNFQASNNSNQNTWTVSPYLTYKINAETDSITFTPSYTETTYAGASGNQQNNNIFRNSKTYNFDLSWQHLWSPRYLSAVNFFYENYESQIPNRQNNLVPLTSDNFGINLTNTYQISDNWKFDATIGGRYTETERGVVKYDPNFGFLADAGIDYTAENYSARLYFNRGLFPSSFGQLQEQTNVGLNFNYNILERLSARLTFNYLKSEAIINKIDNNANDDDIGTRALNRTYIVIEPSVNWQLARNWTLGGSYRYRMQDNQGNIGNGLAGEADSNLFMLSVNYNWQGISKSR